VLGIAWAVLQPFMQMVVFTIFFGRLGGMDQQTGSIPYEVYSYAGLLPWTFFANAVGNGANSLVGSANLITKVCFPRLVIPLSALTAAYRDFRCVVPRDGTACPGRWSGSAPPGSRQRRSTPAA
jgi:lipopolysaccharide transport system permease protein